MIKWDDWSDPNRIYDMWQRNFRDPVPYANFYFSQVYGNNEVVLRFPDSSEDEDDLLMGMIHLNPYTFSMNGSKMNVHYIVGVATDEEYRRQGVMRDLLYHSFSRLKEENECLTYLMPADEAYYLPFDFRFGNPQAEMEFTLEGEAGTYEYEFRDRLTQEEKDACALYENICKKEGYDLFTSVDSEYLTRLEKEAAADFGKLFYVFSKGEYMGRFCAAAEYECLILSRVFCGGEREAFLKNLLGFVRKKFRYTNYQIILDHSWSGDLADFSGIAGMRRMPVKEKAKIMFRILDLEALSDYLRSSRDTSFELNVHDEFFPDNSGNYRIDCREGHVKAVRCGSVSESVSRISVADLTSRIFGGMTHKELNAVEGLSHKAADNVAAILPVGRSCIMEIV